MQKSVTSLACAVFCASALTVGAAPAMAQPATGAIGTNNSFERASTTVEQVQYRGGRRYRGHGGGRGNGGNIALGIGAAIIGGIVLSEAARAEHRGAHGGDWDRCSQTYRSFEPSTGLYTGYDGVRRTCPYLR